MKWFSDTIKQESEWWLNEWLYESWNDFLHYLAQFFTLRSFALSISHSLQYTQKASVIPRMSTNKFHHEIHSRISLQMEALMKIKRE